MLTIDDIGYLNAALALVVRTHADRLNSHLPFPNSVLNDIQSHSLAHIVVKDDPVSGMRMLIANFENGEKIQVALIATPEAPDLEVA